MGTLLKDHELPRVQHSCIKGTTVPSHLSHSQMNIKMYCKGCQKSIKAPSVYLLLIHCWRQSAPSPAGLH